MYREMIKLNKVKAAHSVEQMQKLIREGYVPMHPEPYKEASSDSEHPEPYKEASSAPKQPEPDQAASDDQEQSDQATPDASQSSQPEKPAEDNKASGRGRGTKTK